MRHDQVQADGESVEQQLWFLDRAIQIDANYPAVYQRFIRMYRQSTENKEDAVAIKKTFLDAVASDNPTSMAHFALSNIYWMEEDFDRAKFHMERAYEMDKRIVVVINNLAWILAHQKKPDLPRALELAKTAVDQRPDDGRFRDTYGTILLKMELWTKAVDEFQLALRGNAGKKAVHQKLAIAYSKLGMNDLADIHARKSEE